MFYLNTKYLLRIKWKIKRKKFYYLSVISYCTSYGSHAFSSLIFLFSFSSSLWSATTRGRPCSSFVPYHHRGFEGLVYIYIYIYIYIHYMLCSLVDLFINDYEGSVSNRTGFVNPYCHL